MVQKHGVGAERANHRLLFPRRRVRFTLDRPTQVARGGETSGVCIRLLHLRCTSCDAITNSCTNYNVACRVHVAYIRRMDLISTSSGSALSGQSSADRASVDGRFVGAPAPKRERRQLLTKIDGRLPLGKRIKRLVSLFEAAFPAEALTPLKREQIATAAQLQAMAEEERGKWMRGEAKCSLDELVRLERRAVAAVKALGIEETRAKGPTLADYLAARDGNDGEETE
jgi:hypothetical protein